MNELADRFGLDLLAEPWLPDILLVLVAATAAHLAVHYLFRHAERLSRRTHNIWDDAVVSAAARPARVLVWLVGLALAADIAGRQLHFTLLDLVPPARNIGLVVCLAWFLLRLAGRVADNLVAEREAAGEEVDRTTADALAKLAKLTVLTAAVLSILQILGIGISGILAAGGIGGIAVGFAAKDLLANFFGGLTIYMDRPFAVGDWIRSPDKDIEGTVEHISWRHTRIRRFNKNPLYVPNALFTSIAVENPSRMSNRRIKETIGIRYADLDRMPAIVEDVRNLLIQHPDIDTDQTLIVNFNEFADSSLNFFIYTFTRTTEWARYHAIKQDILLAIAAIISRHGAEIAFPTRTVHLAGGQT